MMYSVYRTTNLKNGKIYVGVHDETEQTYLGSGVVLKEAIKKYGRINFKREAIMLFDNADEAYALEAFIVDVDFVMRKDTYNIGIGGFGFQAGPKHPQHGKPLDPEHAEKVSIGMSSRWDDPDYRAHQVEAIKQGVNAAFESDELKRRVSAGLRRRYKDPREHEKTSNQMKKYIATLSPEQRCARTAAARAACSEKLSCAVKYDGIQFAKIKDLATYLGKPYSTVCKQISSGKILVERIQ